MNFMSPNQQTGVNQSNNTADRHAQQIQKMNGSRGKMQQRYSNYLTQQMIMQNNNGNTAEMGISSNYANSGAAGRASTDITMYSTNQNNIYKQ